ncbi:unnamed protein product [Chrysoparadoxa australica]
MRFLIGLQLGLLMVQLVAGQTLKLLGVVPSTTDGEFGTTLWSVMELAVASVNAEGVLPVGYTLEINRVEGGGSAEACADNVCTALTDPAITNGVHGIVGPLLASEASLLGHLASEFVHLPVVSYAAAVPSDLSSPYVWRVQPKTLDQMKSLVRLILQNKELREDSVRHPSERVAMLYSADEYGNGAALAFVQAVAEVNDEFAQTSAEVAVTLQFDESLGGDFRSRLAKVPDVSRVMVLLTEGYTDLGRNVLRVADELGMVGPLFQWYLPDSAAFTSIFNSDPAVADPSDGMDDFDLAYKAQGTLGVRSCAIDEASEQAFTDRWVSLDQTLYPGSGRASLDEDGRMGPRLLIVYDAVFAIATALSDALSGPDAALVSTGLAAPAQCWSAVWPGGESVNDALGQISFAGISGPVRFSAGDQARLPEDLGSCVVNLRESFLTGGSFHQIMKYDNAEESFSFTTALPQAFPGGADTYPSDRTTLIGARDLQVVVLSAPPFVFIDGSEEEGFVYSGLSIGLMEQLGENLNFTYQLSHLDDDTPTNTVIDMMEVGTFDMAISWITINSPRWQKVSFSYPYYDLGLAFVYAKETAEVSSGIWALFDPFSPGLWLSIFVAVVAIILSLYLFEATQNLDIRNANNYIALGRSSYITFALLAQQLTHKPETLAGYLASLGALTFAFIVGASYTAELASFLTARKVNTSQFTFAAIKSGNFPQDEIALRLGGAVENSYRRDVLGCGTTCNSEQLLYRGCKTTDECLEMVSNGTVKAIILDSPVANYLVSNTYCNLQTSSDLFDLQHYGIVLRPGSPIMNELSLEVLRIRESGLILQLDGQYIFTDTCAQQDDSGDDQGQLTAWDLGGIFIILGVFLSLGLLVHCFWPKVEKFAGERRRRKRQTALDEEAYGEMKGVNDSTISGRSEGEIVTSVSKGYRDLTRSERKEAIFRLLEETYSEVRKSREERSNWRDSLRDFNLRDTLMTERGTMNLMNIGQPGITIAGTGIPLRDPSTAMNHHTAALSESAARGRNRNRGGDRVDSRSSRSPDDVDRSGKESKRPSYTIDSAPMVSLSGSFANKSAREKAAQEEWEDAHDGS